jgi:5-methylcytosine-specific restriction protein A
MTRHEFGKPVRRAARLRSGGRCEANDPVYGLEPGVRCNVSLAKGVDFDHWPFPAGDEGSDVLENCMAVCPTCHRKKTSTYDVPVLAKGKRVADKARGITNTKRGGFRKAEPQRTATRAIVRKADRRSQEEIS